jgi:protein-L-isoaspartate(D-aspartate) O-methyltransferase
MQKLVDQLIKEEYLQSLEIIEAFLRIDRADFIPKSTHWGDPYGNYPVPIGFGQTISQPATVAFMLELLRVKSGDKILEIGSGSGWLTALLAVLTGHTGKVYALEILKKLKTLGEKNCQKYHFDNLVFIKGNGAKGLPKQKPFDKIVVSAAAQEIPQALKEQLAIGGRMVIPVGRPNQDLFLIKKITKDKYREERHPGFLFVPLI